MMDIVFDCVLIGVFLKGKQMVCSFFKDMQIINYVDMR